MLERLAGVLFLSLLVGFLITSRHNAQSALAQRLTKGGQKTQAVIVEKEATSSGQGRDFCYVTYQFEAPQVHAVTAPSATFKNKVEVSDAFFDNAAEGQSVPVIYDPRDPTTSMLETEMRSPRPSAWLVWIWWIGTGIAMALLLRSYLREARFSSQGTLVHGSIISISTPGESEDDFLEVRYAFCLPSGETKEGAIRKEIGATNYLQMSQRAHENDSMAILYVSDSSYLVL